MAPGFTYKTMGTHGGFGEELGGTESNSIGFSEEDPCAYCDENEACLCECAGGTWELVPDAPGQCNTESPLLIDLERNDVQYKLTSVERGVPFDFNGDGAYQQVAWTSPNTSVGFIVRDRNGNGTIDNGSELFGNHTRKRDGTRARHAFEALADLDDDRDGQISARDAVFSDLRLWVDRNHNGESEPAELSTLGEAGITRLFTAYIELPRCDRHGNRYKYRGTASLVGPAGNEVSRRMFDVFFKAGR